MGSSFCATAALVTFFAAISLHAQQPSQTPAQQYQQLAQSTQLDREGAQPFHLKIDAQIYDISGKPTDTGTIEEWWAAPGEYRIETSSGSLHEVIASGQPSVGVEDTRASYLLDLLLRAMVHPLHPLAPSEDLTLDQRQYGKLTLDCFRYGRPPVQSSSACADPSDGMLRAQVRNTETIVRNSVGKFQGTDVALAIKISYMGHDAVFGKITALEAFTPGSPGAPTLTVSKVPDSPNHPPVSVGGGVISGRLARKVNPDYPDIARLHHIGGTVLLHAIITREGKVRALFVIASPNPLLSEAAMEAVRQWAYTPYLLNGQPTEVDTTIAVNFNLN